MKMQDNPSRELVSIKSKISFSVNSVDNEDRVMKGKPKKQGVKILLCLAFMFFALLTMTAAMAQTSSTSGSTSQPNGSADQPDGGNNNTGTAWTSRQNYLLRFPVAAEAQKFDTVTNGVSAPNGTVMHTSGASPVYMWPSMVPTASSSVPTQRDQVVGQDLFQTFGYPVSDSQFQIIERYNHNRLLEQMFDPERAMWTTQTAAGMGANNTANSIGSSGVNQVLQAIDYCSMYLNNFTAEPGNVWQTIRDQLFIPMAVLLLLPGAVLAQVRAIVAQGSPVLIGQEVHPFEGILRSIVAIFLIPGSFLVINYGIDVGNSITYTIANEYSRLFTSDMYSDAKCAILRAVPVGQAKNRRNAITQSEKPTSQGTTVWAVFEGYTLITELRDPCAGIDNVQTPDEDVTYTKSLTRLFFNMVINSIGMTWDLACTFQMVYLYYLWCMGPIAAALWVWPVASLRKALGSWCEGVITVCFWSLFWNTVILLMACFRGVGDSGTIVQSALLMLAISSVKSAFDFGGLASEVVSSAMSYAARASSAMGSGGSGSQAAGHGAGTGRNTSTPGGAHAAGAGAQTHPQALGAGGQPSPTGASVSTQGGSHGTATPGSSGSGPSGTGSADSSKSAALDGSKSGAAGTADGKGSTSGDTSASGAAAPGGANPTVAPPPGSHGKGKGKGGGGTDADGGAAGGGTGAGGSSSTNANVSLSLGGNHSSLTNVGGDHPPMTGQSGLLDGKQAGDINPNAANTKSELGGANSATLTGADANKANANLLGEHPNALGPDGKPLSGSLQTSNSDPGLPGGANPNGTLPPNSALAHNLSGTEGTNNALASQTNNLGAHSFLSADGQHLDTSKVGPLPNVSAANAHDPNASLAQHTAQDIMAAGGVSNDKLNQALAHPGGQDAADVKQATGVAPELLKAGLEGNSAAATVAATGFGETPLASKLEGMSSTAQLATEMARNVDPSVASAAALNMDTNAAHQMLSSSASQQFSQTADSFRNGTADATPLGVNSQTALASQSDFGWVGGANPNPAAIVGNSSAEQAFAAAHPNLSASQAEQAFAQQSSPASASVSSYSQAEQAFASAHPNLSASQAEQQFAQANPGAAASASTGSYSQAEQAFASAHPNLSASQAEQQFAQANPSYASAASYGQAEQAFASAHPNLSASQAEQQFAQANPGSAAAASSYAQAEQTFAASNPGLSAGQAEQQFAQANPNYASASSYSQAEQQFASAHPNLSASQAEQQFAQANPNYGSAQSYNQAEQQFAAANPNLSASQAETQFAQANPGYTQASSQSSAPDFTGGATAPTGSMQAQVSAGGEFGRVAGETSALGTSSYQTGIAAANGNLDSSGATNLGVQQSMISGNSTGPAGAPDFTLNSTSNFAHQQQIGGDQLNSNMQFNQQTGNPISGNSIVDNSSSSGMSIGPTSTVNLGDTTAFHSNPTTGGATFGGDFNQQISQQGGSVGGGQLFQQSIDNSSASSMASYGSPSGGASGSSTSFENNFSLGGPVQPGSSGGGSIDSGSGASNFTLGGPNLASGGFTNDAPNFISGGSGMTSGGADVYRDTGNSSQIFGGSSGTVQGNNYETNLGGLQLSAGSGGNIVDNSATFGQNGPNYSAQQINNDASSQNLYQQGVGSSSGGTGIDNNFNIQGPTHYQGDINSVSAPQNIASTGGGTYNDGTYTTNLGSGFSGAQIDNSVTHNPGQIWQDNSSTGSGVPNSYGQSVDNNFNILGPNTSGSGSSSGQTWSDPVYNVASNTGSAGSNDSGTIYPSPNNYQQSVGDGSVNAYNSAPAYSDTWSGSTGGGGWGVVDNSGGGGGQQTYISSNDVADNAPAQINPPSGDSGGSAINVDSWNQATAPDSGGATHYPGHGGGSHQEAGQYMVANNDTSSGSTASHASHPSHAPAPTNYTATNSGAAATGKKFADVLGGAFIGNKTNQTAANNKSAAEQARNATDKAAQAKTPPPTEVAQNKSAPFGPAANSRRQSGKSQRDIDEENRRIMEAQNNIPQSGEQDA